MNSLFEDLRDGLIEAIEIERGNLKGRTKYLTLQTKQETVLNNERRYPNDYSRQTLQRP